MFKRHTNAARQAAEAVARLAVCSCVAALVGCASTPASSPTTVPMKRHSAAEIAGYVPAQFSTPVTSTEVARRLRDEALAKLPLAAAPGADEVLVADALRAVAFYETETEAGRRLLRAALADPAQPFVQRGTDFQRAVLTAAYTFDAAGAAPLIAPLLDTLATPRQFAIAAYTLRKADAGVAQRERLLAALARRADAQQEPRLQALAQALADDAAARPLRTPPLVDLLAAPYTPGLPVLFSLQRKDRAQRGIAVVRDVDGRFVRAADGSLFSVPQLALALSGLPGTITLGNTPQGVFTVVGAGTAENPWIGPTPFLEAKIPKEATLAEYAHAPPEPVPAAWTVERYEAWLPPSWRAYAPMHEAWLAGLAGRDEMYAHGTAMDPEPYRGHAYYPGTPTDGCLTTHEVWSAQGVLLRSDQLALAQAFTRSGQVRGYLVVVEIDEQPRPVSADEVLQTVLAAEARR